MALTQSLAVGSPVPPVELVSARLAEIGGASPHCAARIVDVDVPLEERRWGDDPSFTWFAESAAEPPMDAPSRHAK